MGDSRENLRNLWSLKESLEKESLEKEKKLK